MTVIEFFDRTPIENIIGSITVSFNKIIFVGDNRLMSEFKPIYKDFLHNRGILAEVCYRGINKNNLWGIVEVLSEIVEQEEQCFFDLTGGEDLALVAMGIVFERYRHKNIQMEHFNLNSTKSADADNDGRLVSTLEPNLTIEEFISLHGGKIRYALNENEDIGTFKWSFTADFIRDINLMWEICRKDPKKWNSEIYVILKMCEFLHNQNSLYVTANLSALEDFVNNWGGKFVSPTELLNKLQSAGLIRGLSTKNGELAFTFKNAQVKKCLTKAGTVLELKVTTLAMAATRKDGSHIYSQAMNGVFIDWDGGDQKETDTFNEIDVVLLGRFTPIFISCKNGQVDDEELYKLETVANRFGGENVKKVLIATYFGKQGDRKKHFEKRANDMGIEFIEQAHLLDPPRFDGVIKQLINS